MTATFPNSVKTFTTLVDYIDDVLAAHQNERGEEITAVETYLIGMQTPYRLSVTVASNNLTVALKNANGDDPSPTAPVRVQIGDAVRTISSALSVTVNAGTATFGFGGATGLTGNFGLYVYLGWRAASSAVVLGISPIGSFNLYSDFSTTATDVSYGAFSTAPASTDKVVNIGYFEAANSGTASYNWSVPTFVDGSNLIHRQTLPKLFALQASALSFNPVDATTYYWGGSMGEQPNTASLRARIYMGVPGVIRGIRIVFSNLDGVASSNEDISMYLSWNNATLEPLIATVGNTAATKFFTNTNMSLLTAGFHAIEIKMVCPTWATNPTAVRLAATLWSEVK